MDPHDRLTPEQLAAGLAAREARAAEREAGRAAMREQFEQEAQRNAALFFDEHGSPIDFPTILEGLVRAIDTRLGKLEIQKDAVEEVRAAVTANTKATEKLATDCAPMIEFAKAVSGFTKFMNYLSSIAKPVGWTIFGLSALVIFVVAAWNSFWTGTPLPIKK